MFTKLCVFTKKTVSCLLLVLKICKCVIYFIVLYFKIDAEPVKNCVIFN